MKFFETSAKNNINVEEVSLLVGVLVVMVCGGEVFTFDTR